MSDEKKLKVLVFIVAYNAEKTITSVLDRIPKYLSLEYQVEVLIIDDCSSDDTFERANKRIQAGYWCDVTVLRNPVNQGYGGNQKIGYRFAIRKGCDVVALLHGDGQYAPESLPELLAPFAESSPPAAVFGSRMMNKRSALQGGMPLYKYLANRFLTTIENLVLGQNHSEYHTGFRAYHKRVLVKLPFHAFSDDFVFDQEILISAVYAGFRIGEIPVPTRYFPEASQINFVRSVKYGLETLLVVLKYVFASTDMYRSKIFPAQT